MARPTAVVTDRRRRDRPTPAVVVASVELPHALSAVSQARRMVEEHLVTAGYDEDARFDAKLIVTELITNAVRHADPLPHNTVGLVIETTGDGLVRIETLDGGGETDPVPARPDLESPGGRGLLLVSQLAADWSVRSVPHGRAVSATLSRG